MLYGDVPLIKASTLLAFQDAHISSGRDLTIMSTTLDDPSGYGRVIESAHGEVMGIVEEKDASTEDKKIKKYIPLSKRQDKPDSALWLIKHHSLLKDSQIAKLVGITKASVTAIKNKSYWNYNNLNPKDPVALGLFSQKDLIEAIEKAERRIKREKKEKEKAKLTREVSNIE